MFSSFVALKLLEDTKDENSYITLLIVDEIKIQK